MNTLGRYIAFFLRLTATIITMIVLWRAGGEYYDFAWGLGTWLGGFTPKLGWGFIALIFVFTVIFISTVVILWRREITTPLERILIHWRDKLGILRWLLVLTILIAPVWTLQFNYWGGVFTGPYLRILTLAGMSISIAALITREQNTLVRIENLIVSLLLTGGVLFFGHAFRFVTEYPFSLYWSEGNRIWDYSVLFGRRLYNYPADQTIFAFIDLGRQSLWGLPFLLGDVSIRTIRIWHGIVTSLPYALLGLVAFQFSRKHFKLWLLCGVWTFAYLSNGPIYTPLVLSAILVAFAWRRPPWIALPLIAIAGYYAEMSRFTWMFAPAIWAFMLYFVDRTTTYRGERPWNWRMSMAGGLAGLLGGYIIPKWTNLLGLISALQNQVISSPSEAIAEEEISSLVGIGDTVTRQPLLWERLLPNPTYGPGIILALALVTVPTLIFLLYLVRTRHWKIDWLRRGVLLATLLAFLSVGLVISVKIGGGADLHNMDMFLITVVFAAALAWRAGAHSVLENLAEKPVWLKLLFVLMMLIFAYKPLRSASPIDMASSKVVAEALENIDTEVRSASKAGEVLFIDQRQLLTFGFVEKIPLVPDYEKKYIMDQAMASNANYFKDFYRDLERQRFALIVSEPLHTRLKGQAEVFG
ncbi:MAG: hypothetical protein JSV61_09635, partial [Anaerolineales bacterium]